MSLAFFTDLARQTLFDPRGAASRLIALRLPVRWLWMALALMTVLNAMAYSVSLQVSVPSEGAAMFPPALRSPVLFALLLGAGLVGTVLALTWIGRLMKGRAQVADILVLIAWLQVLRLAVQILSLLLVLLVPGLVGLLVIAASVWGLVILVGFVDRAHGFGNWGKAAAMLLLSALAMVMVLSLILMMAGVGPVEGT